MSETFSQPMIHEDVNQGQFYFKVFVIVSLFLIVAFAFFRFFIQSDNPIKLVFKT